ncbi:hypothetical protein AB0N92_09485 [Streptomyces sp. NPDC093248]|uniref:hypothetical protein n=1 Tax=Streptomyces sp. NPDC093248 TaxID=3155072 RepID=UPI00341DF9FA
MSYGLGIHIFVDGEPVQPDLDAVRELLAPFEAAPEKEKISARDFWIRAADGGEAEVSVDDYVIAVERPHRGEILSIVAMLANRLGGVIEPGNGTLLCCEVSRDHLPDGLATQCTFLPEFTREAIEAAITRSRR